MSSTSNSPAAAGSRGNGIPRVIVATTALLDIYLLLACCGYCPERFGVFGVLRRWRSRRVHRQDRAMVHSGDHVVFVRGARGVRRKLQHVRTRRRVPRRKAVARRSVGEIQRVGADVRLHPHRSHQRGVCWAIHRWAAQRSVPEISLERRVCSGDDRSASPRPSPSSLPFISGGKIRKECTNPAKKLC